MNLELLGLRGRPKTKPWFAVHVRIDGKKYRTQARVYPRQGHSVEFTQDPAAALLYKAGRKLRKLCSLIAAAHRGERLEYPVRIEESAAPAGMVVTISPGKKLPLVGVG